MSIYAFVRAQALEIYSLICERQPGNAHDIHAVSIKKAIDGEIKIVGHIPRKISVICLKFMRRGGNIQCQVNGAR